MAAAGLWAGVAYATSTSTTLNSGDSLTVRCGGSGLSWTQSDNVDGVATCAPTTTTTTSASTTTSILPPTAANYSEASGYPIDASGTGLATVTITPRSAGDLIVLFVELYSGSRPTVRGVSSSNATWNATPAALNDDSLVPLHVELWYGTATSTASASATISYSGSVSSDAIEIISDEFHANTTGTWAVAQGGSADGSSATVQFPSLTSSNGGLYVGYSGVGSSSLACTTVGFTCWDTPTANVELRETNLAASTAYSPSATQSANSEYTSTAGIFYLSGSAPPPTTTSTTSTVPPSTTTTTVAPAGNCTSPVYTTTDATGTYNTDPNDGAQYWWVNNDAWDGGHGPQTLNVCSESNWSAVSDQPDIGGAVETYPDTEYDVGGRANPSTETIAQFASITSTFAEDFPASGAWDAAYDLWLNNWGTEIMIWNEWAGGQGYWPAQATIALTLDGVHYHFYDNGGELMFFRDTQVKSGSVDILAAFNWLVSQGLVMSTDVPTQLEYGVEVCSTSGAETFPVTGLTFSVS
jgi:hypothetical protein